MSTLVSYRIIVFAISISFLILYPSPIQLLGFAVYSYAVLYISVTYLKSQKKLLMTLATIGPMFMMKLEINNSIFQFAGLSYITFRTVQTVVDTNSKKELIGLIDFMSFVLFTPTLLIGPIDRSDRFLKNLNDSSSISITRFVSGLDFLLKGLLYKFVFAALVSDFWLEEITTQSFWGHVNYMYAYTLYLFFDFAGYSALAVGFGKCLGIDVPINFNKPFLAQNPSDFWKRWHKSLGDWLRDFFFRPIYKELSSKKLVKSMVVRQNIALFSTFFLMGCWNGFQLHYIASGALFGLYSVVHNSYVYQCKKKKRDVIFGEINLKIVRVISIVIMIQLSCFSIYIFSGKLF
ncbi:MAG: MBOAT family O-acyltransferase [Flavobacteriales bacterium]